MHARETAAYWVEYVIRHKGAPHLRFPGADLNFWQYNSVDVVLTLLVIVYIVTKIICILIKFLLAKLCKTGKTKIKLN